MKKVFKDKILNIDGNKFDKKFLYEIPNSKLISENIEIFFIEDLLKLRKNEELLNNIWDKYAMFSNVYSPKDELEIFKDIFENALNTWKRTHIVWISLSEEVEILEKYYRKLWFMRSDVNCFELDFSVPLVTVSVKLENLMWKGSDYKSQKEKIYFIPPPRESSNTKNLFKWINKWIISWIYLENLNIDKEIFISDLIKNETILPIRMAEILNYNFSEIWFEFKTSDFIIEY